MNKGASSSSAGSTSAMSSRRLSSEKRRVAHHQVKRSRRARSLFAKGALISGISWMCMVTLRQMNGID
jgi:hypothetical protein